MVAFFYWTGLLVWVAIALHLTTIILVALARTTSFYIMSVAAVFTHRRHRLVKWHKLPGEFLATWWKWAMYGPPDTISSQYARWEGTFKWRVEPRKHTAG